MTGKAVTHWLVVKTDEPDWEVEGEHSFEACGIWVECSSDMSGDGLHEGFDPESEEIDGDFEDVMRHGDEHRRVNGMWCVRGSGCAYTEIEYATDYLYEIALDRGVGRHALALEGGGDEWSVIAAEPEAQR